MAIMDPTTQSLDSSPSHAPGPSTTLAAAVSRIQLDSDSRANDNLPSAPFNGKNGAKIRRANAWPSFHWNDNDDVYRIQRTSSVPPVKFNLFPKLAAELRCKIWHWAAQHPRLIEIERCEATPSASLGNQETHPAHRVCPKSCLPPALFRVNKEAREEAMKAYEMRIFDSDHGKLSPRKIYFNLHADIIYFAENTCVATMIRLFIQVAGRKQTIPRVAIEVVKRCEFGCEHDTLLDTHCLPVYEMQALHGFDNKGGLRPEFQWNGCPGLEEVFFVVKTNAGNIESGAVDASVGFCPASTLTNGITKDQRLEKKNLENEIGLTEYGIDIFCRSQTNSWLEESPQFRFVTLTPGNTRCRDDRKHSTIFIKQKGIKILAQNDWSIVKRMESRTGCHITIPKDPFPRRQPLEFVLYGTEASIEKAKQALTEKAMTYEDIQKWRRGIMKEPIKRETEETTTDEE